MDLSNAMSQINWLAVIVAALSSFLIGGLWYSPMLFAKAWMKENNFTEESLKENPKMGMIFGTTFILSLIASFNLAMFLAAPGIDAIAGMMAGALAGIGWVATMIGTHYLFERKSLKLFFINAGYSIIALMVMGLIIGAWR